MNLSESSLESIQHCLRKAIFHYATGEEPTIVTDIHIQPKQDSGELIIFNDDDDELAHILVEEWIDNADDSFYSEVEELLRSCLVELRKEGFFDTLSLMKPYSFVMVDDEKETLSELLLIDDDTLVLGDELLRGLDKDLNDFLEKLMKE